GSRWLLAWNYQPELAPFEQDLDLKCLGELKNIHVNPGIMPTGTTTYEFERGKTKILIEFSCNSCRLRGVALHRD
ncbi:MAG TPA: hypothetical protein VKP30_07310, partial [Polyangiaceae bacterium]|nr:hypothetical protein [Polyangiaceae bacterium]